MIHLLDYKYVKSSQNHGMSAFSPRIVGPCPYCGSIVEQRYSEFGSGDYYSSEEFLWESYACPLCGWWWSGSFPEHSYSNGSTDVGILHQVRPCPEGLHHAVMEMNAASERLFSMNPTKFEIFVGDMFRNFYDCRVIHCGKSHDGGIDLLILDTESGPIPVQIKRRSTSTKTEPVSVIREFRGALLLSGHTRGKIVTTADHFSKEAVDAATPKNVHSIVQEVDLVDCRRLLNIIRVLCFDQSQATQVRQRHSFTSVDPEARVKQRIIEKLDEFARRHGWSECSSMGS